MEFIRASVQRLVDAVIIEAAYEAAPDPKPAADAQALGARVSMMCTIISKQRHAYLDRPGGETMVGD